MNISQNLCSLKNYVNQNGKSNSFVSIKDMVLWCTPYGLNLSVGDMKHFAFWLIADLDWLVKVLHRIETPGLIHHDLMCIIPCIK